MIELKCYTASEPFFLPFLGATCADAIPAAFRNTLVSEEIKSPSASMYLQPSSKNDPGVLYPLIMLEPEER
jgi:hypothetical protein